LIDVVLQPRFRVFLLNQALTVRHADGAAQIGEAVVRRGISAVAPNEAKHRAHGREIRVDRGGEQKRLGGIERMHGWHLERNAELLGTKERMPIGEDPLGRDLVSRALSPVPIKRAHGHGHKPERDAWPLVVLLEKQVGKR
jgi:hypothetical protein